MSRIVSTVLAFLLLVCYGRARAAEPPFTKIIHELSSLQLVNTARFELKGKAYVRANTFGTAEPPTDMELVFKEQLVVDLGGSRIRRRFDGEVLSSEFTKIRRVEVFLFDGTDAQTYTPRSENSDLQTDKYKYTTELSTSSEGPLPFFLSRIDEGLLMTLGILPQRDRSFSVTREVRIPLDSDVLSIAGDSVERGRECVVLRSGNLSKKDHVFFDLFLDSDRLRQLRRFSLTRKGKESQRLEFEYKDDLVSRITRYDLVSQTLVVDSDVLVDTELNVDVSDVVFHISAKEGMIVAGPDHRRYRTAPDGGKGASVEVLHRQELAQSGRLRKWFIILSSVLVVTGLSAFAWWRGK